MYSYKIYTSCVLYGECITRDGRHNAQTYIPSRYHTKNSRFVFTSRVISKENTDDRKNVGTS
jgi:hypothetical protein